MLAKETCPHCGHDCKKNGHIHNGKQRYKCLNLACARQFVLDGKKKYITQETYALIDRLLLERLSLRAICRAANVSFPWLSKHMKRLYRLEADELCSFVQKKSNKKWLWLVMNTANRQIISFHVGNRGKEDAKKRDSVII